MTCWRLCCILQYYLIFFKKRKKNTFSFSLMLGGIFWSRFFMIFKLLFVSFVKALSKCLFPSNSFWNRIRFCPCNLEDHSFYYNKPIRMSNIHWGYINLIVISKIKESVKTNQFLHLYNEGIIISLHPTPLYTLHLNIGLFCCLIPANLLNHLIPWKIQLHRLHWCFVVLIVILAIDRLSVFLQFLNSVSMLW
jgi:hypothetical protein